MTSFNAAYELYKTTGNYDALFGLLGDEISIDKDLKDFKQKLVFIVKCLYVTPGLDFVHLKILKLLSDVCVSRPEVGWILLENFDFIGILVKKYYTLTEMDGKTEILKYLNQCLIFIYKECTLYSFCSYRCCETRNNQFIKVEELYKICQMICLSLVEREQIMSSYDKNYHMTTLVILLKCYNLTVNIESCGSQELYTGLRSKLVKMLDSQHDNYIALKAAYCIYFTGVMQSKAEDNQLCCIIEMTKSVITEDMKIGPVMAFIIVQFLKHLLKEKESLTALEKHFGEASLRSFCRGLLKNKYFELGFSLIASLTHDHPSGEYFVQEINKESELLTLIISTCQSESDCDAYEAWKLLRCHINPSIFPESAIKSLVQVLKKNIRSLIAILNDTYHVRVLRKMILVNGAIQVLYLLCAEQSLWQYFLTVAQQEHIVDLFNEFLITFVTVDTNVVLKCNVNIIPEMSEWFCENKEWYLTGCQLTVSMLYLLSQFNSNAHYKMTLGNFLELPNALKVLAIVMCQCSMKYDCEMALMLVYEALNDSLIDIPKLAGYLMLFCKIKRYLPMDSKENMNCLKFNKTQSSDIDIEELRKSIESTNIDGDGGDRNLNLFYTMKTQIDGLVEGTRRLEELILEKDKYIAVLHSKFDHNRVSIFESKLNYENLMAENFSLDLEIDKQKKITESEVEKNIQLTSELKSTKAEVNELKEVVDQMQQEVSHLTNKLEKTSSDLQFNLDKNRTLRTQVMNMGEENEKLKKDLHKAGTLQSYLKSLLEEGCLPDNLQ